MARTLPLVLASQSAQRQAILAGLGLEFVVAPADIDEAAVQHDDHLQRVVEVAHAKAKAVAGRFPQHLVLAADTYVLCNGKSYEKPSSPAEAKKMLAELSAQPCQELTGVCLLNTSTGQEETATIAVDFVFRALSTAEIERYVEFNPVTQWSAAFSPAYPAGAALIATVNGSLTGFTHGLPVEWVMSKIDQMSR